MIYLVRFSRLTASKPYKLHEKTHFMKSQPVFSVGSDVSGHFFSAIRQVSGHLLVYYLFRCTVFRISCSFAAY